MPTEHSAQILDPTVAADSERLDKLRADSTIEVLDNHRRQLTSLRDLRPQPNTELLSEPGRWAYYPWRRTVISVLGPRGFRALRLDRNRNNITADEQTALSRLSIGVAGLSVGHIIAHTLATQGLCGRLHLADFDDLELSNLNRVPATVFDLGVNKAVIAARRIAEIDPYLPVQVFDAGLTADTLDEFIERLDIVVEECDSLEMKAVLRVAARDRHLPVLMATSDRGIVDVERFDQEPERPILHGLLGELDLSLLPGMSNRDKIPHVLRHLEAERLSPRTAASLIEIDRSLSTWPQLASDVGIGASAVAEAVRRIGLNEELRSGRVRIDIGWALNQIDEPDMGQHNTNTPSPELPQDLSPQMGGLLGDLAAAAMRAPSGGNVQPWRITARSDAVIISVATEFTATMDVEYRASAVAIGAALHNTRIAAAARNALGPVTLSQDAPDSPLQATLSIGVGTDTALAALYEPMMARVTNRHYGTVEPLAADTVAALTAAAEAQQCRLHLITTTDELDRAADILAAADRIRFLTPRLHAEMIGELRWPGDPDPNAGIDVRSLEFDPGDMAVLGVLRRPDVMAHLAQWKAGSALGDDMRDRVLSSSALAIVKVRGHELIDYAHGGAGVEAVWIAAQQHGWGVQPVSPVFLYAHTAAELAALSTPFADELSTLQSEFNPLAQVGAEDSVALILRLAITPPPSVPSRRSTDRVVLEP